MTANVRHDLPPPTVGPPPPRPVGRAIGRALVVTAGFLLILAGIVLALLLWRSEAHEVTETSTTHTGVDRIELDLRAVGTVDLITHDSDEVVVQRRVATTSRGTEVDEVVEGGVLTVSSTRCPNDWFVLFDRCSASFRIRAPEGTEIAGASAHGNVTLDGPTGAVDLRTSHGSVDARGSVGPVNLETRHGNVSVTDLEGALTLDTRHGSVEVVDSVGTIRVASGHGRITVRGGEGDLHLDTSHGSIEVTGTDVGVAELETKFGGVEFHPGSAPTSVSIATSHGDVDARLPDDAPPYAVTTSASGNTRVDIATDPASDHHLDIETRFGSIDVRPEAP